MSKTRDMRHETRDTRRFGLPGPPKASEGFTFIELLIGVAMLSIAIAALMGAFLGQVILNEHARNLTWAINDANRVLERIRQLNIGCSVPSATPPVAECGGPCTNAWDTWLANGGGGKSIQPDPANNERVVVTCQNSAGSAPCGATDDPIRITVAVCWRHRGRVLGECSSALAPTDGSNGFANNGVIESQAMLTTLMTCRQQ